jgi:23S rRNA (adenine2030-N6)-methyltransferase
VNYRHAYHAGSFTDVVKHIVLIALVLELFRKEAPICYIDTHAGMGQYDLFSESAQKTREYETGIEKLIQQSASKPPPLVQRFLDLVHQFNNRLSAAKYASLRYYPGSPMLARLLARAHDRVVACELQPEAYQALKNTFAGDKKVAVHHMDGFLGLKAFLPPQERRGLVLIDPPYEGPDELTHIIRALAIALKRWNTGIYAIWFPIKEKAAVHRFYNTLKKSLSRPIYIVELTIYPEIPNHLNGCGIAIVNPPWQLDQAIQAVLPWIWKALTINGQGGHYAGLLK